MGATGRIGMILRKYWDEPTISWQARTPQSGGGWVVLDPLGDPGALARAAGGCAAILCLAGVVPGRAGAGAPGAMAGNIALAEAALRAAEPGARVLLASSAAVYGARPGLLREDDVPAPLSEYGRAKADMERRGAELGAARDVAVSALRIGNVAGVDAILGGWRPGFRLDRFADGCTPRRSYIGVQTLARVLRDLIVAPDLPGVLNIAAPGAIGMGDLLDAANLDWTPRRAPDTAIAEVRLCTDRLVRLTGFGAAESTPAAMVEQWRETGSGTGSEDIRGGRH
ncbi:NAD-dependent epimerase/dehydratase family protein [Sedimentitalea sp. XS_ASV28]|uniref:NAD-dependent epimerase/dehydratase family protein n=1 Tax=Sedimentitalea sp. XS_ASV28 TaxID=3241296 RepID=UPI003514C1A6